MSHPSPPESTARRVAVLGGGAAGILAAHELAAGGHPVTLLEAAPRLGGLQASQTIEGLTFDIGTFLFHETHDYFWVFPDLRARFPRVDYAPVALTPTGGFDRFPLTVGGYVRAHGWGGLARDLLDVGVRKVTCRRRSTLIEFLHYYLGRRIYRRSGLPHYIERFFGVPDGELDVEFAYRRLERIPERCSIRRNAARLLQWPGGRGAGGPPRVHVRPPEGFGPVFDVMESALRAAGVDVRTGEPAPPVEGTPGHWTMDLAGGRGEFESIVSTIPMERAAALIGRTLPVALQYVTMVSLFYRFRGEPAFPGWCLYNLSPGGPWKRITLFSRCYGLIEGDHYLTVECPRPGGVDPGVEALALEFEEHVQRHGVFPGRLRCVGSAVTPRAYPVYRAGDADRLRAARALLESAGLVLFGRQGQFDYSHSDELGRRARRREWGCATFAADGRRRGAPKAATHG